MKVEEQKQATEVVTTITAILPKALLTAIEQKALVEQVSPSEIVKAALTTYFIENSDPE